MKSVSEYKNLVDFLLKVVRERPAMYLGEAKLSRLPNFITGYNIGYHIAAQNDEGDGYFDQQHGFLQWFYNKYNIEQTSFWETLFLSEAQGDDKQALLLFFKYLEEYQKENIKKDGDV